MADTYKGTVVASQSSAKSMGQYTLAGAFPLFIIKSENTALILFYVVYEKLHIS